MKMKVTSFPLMLLMVVLLLNACKKDDDSFIVKTLEVSNIGSHTATLNGEVISDEAPVTGWGFFWSETNSKPSEDDEILIIGNLTGDFSAELDRFEPETKYYVRAYASDLKKVFYGQTVEFTTNSPSLPTVTTENITNITQTSATSGGNVTSDGGATITARGVCWNTTGNPTIDDTKTNDGTGAGTFTSSITGLTANTTYFVRAYATNGQGTAYGQKVEFNSEVIEWQRDTQTAVVDVTNPATGKTWMDRNLGASRVATRSTDEEAYGDLYQWGRAADGHQKRNSPVTTTLSSSDTPGHGNFILSNGDANWDWRSPQNTDLWQGVNGTNNPCPSGYRLPTIAEWETERQNWSRNNAAGAFASPLKLPVAGYRIDNGLLSRVGSYSYFWSSTVDGGYSRSFGANSGAADWSRRLRAYGCSVRCIKD